MSSPCEEKSQDVVEIFERVYDNGAPHTKGAILLKIDGKHNMFIHLTGGHEGEVHHHSTKFLRRIYPLEEPKETIELMGKTYDKAEIEKALSQVKAIS